jgi:acyl-CoA thioester hydrolase
MIDLLQTPGLVLTLEGVVESRFVDAMGHMNVAFYAQLFDRAVWARFAGLGLTEAYLARERRGMVALEQSTRYLSELREGQPLTIHTALVEAREKTLRFVHYMRNVESNTTAARAEVVAAHVDLATRRTTAFAPELAARFATEVTTALPGRSMTEAEAQAFARGWIDHWNHRDVEAVLAHYVDDAEFVSPKAEVITGNPLVKGKMALRAYWQAALSQCPNLEFTLDAALFSQRSETLTVLYRAAFDGQPPQRSAEVMRFVGPTIVRGEAFYGGSALGVPPG